MTASTARRRLWPRGDDGAATVEYVGVALVVVAVVSSLVLGATPVGGLVAAKLCDAFGATCSVPGAVDADGDRVPERACTQSTSTEQMKGKVSVAFVDVGSKGTLAIETLSDGTFKVQLGGELGVAAVASAGEATGGLSIGGYGGKVQLTADASGGVFGAAGAEYEFSSQQEVDDFVEYVHRELVKEGASTVVGAGNPVVGVGVDAAGWLWDTVTGYDYAPPSPDYVYGEGGVAVGASAGADAVVAGGNASASASDAVGFKYGTGNGQVVLYNRIKIDAAAAAKLGLSTSDGDWGVGGSGNGSVELVVETTLDAGGNVTALALNGAATADGSMALTALAGYPLDGEAGRGVRVAATVDVTDANRGRVTALLGGLGVISVPGQPLSGPATAIPLIIAEARESGDITAQTLDVSSSSLLEAALALKAPAVGGLGFEIGASTGKQSTIDAYYLGKNGWKDWTAC